MSLPFTDTELMRLYVEAEFTHDGAGQLVLVNEPGAAAAPRFFLGHTAGGTVHRYRHDVSNEVRRALAAASALEALGDPTADVPLDATRYEHILSHEVPVQRTSVGLAYRFPHTLPPAAGTRHLHNADDAALLEPLLPAWIPDVQASQPLVAFVLDGRAVSVCASVRITPRAHEAGVETAPEFRGHGFAAATVVAWAPAVRQRGAEPLYSTWWPNAASRRLARKLALVSFGRDLHIT